MKTSKLLPILTIVALCGCATIVNKPSQKIAINSQPSGASVKIVDEDGVNVYNGVTPSTAALKKGRGYFKSKSYKVTVSKSGYSPTTINLTARVSGWYIGGNFVFGGLLGWLVVDPLTGAMFTLDPKEVSVDLSSNVSVLENDDTKQISVLLLEDVPENMRSKLVPIKN